MKIKKIIPILLICFCCVFMTGCWDKVEIDQRTFIISMGVDLEKNSSNKLRVTYSFPLLENSKDGIKKTKNLSIYANSLSEAENKFGDKSSKVLYLGHTKILFISSDVFKDKKVLNQIIDYTERQPSISKNIIVLVCDGDTKDYINFKTGLDENIEKYISGIMNNSKMDNSIQKVRLNNFLAAMKEGGNILLPEISMNLNKDEVLLDKNVVVKNYQIIGELNEEQCFNIEILKGKLKSYKKTILYHDKPVSYSVYETNRNIKYKEKNGKMYFDLNINLKGKINGEGSDSDLLSESQIHEIENEFSKIIKNDCMDSIKLVQNKYGIDYIDLNNYIRKYHPNIWKKYKNNWNEKFKQSNINVNIKCT